MAEWKRRPYYEDPIRMAWDVASLDNTLYDDYLCLVVSNKQQIYGGRSQTLIGNLGKRSTPKRVRPK